MSEEPVDTPSGLVGRGSELEYLATALDEHRPVVVVGRAGIGKTSLARAAAWVAQLPLFEGGGLASLPWMSYLPLERALGGVPRGDPEAVAGAVCEEVAEGVLCVDDLQWADPATLGVLPRIVERTRVILIVRSGEVRSMQVREIAQRTGATELEIAGLDEHTARQLVQHLAPEIGDDRRREIVRASHGNPLLIEQLSATSDAVDLPDSVWERFNLLPPSARDAMARLALLGRPASRDELGNGVEHLDTSPLVSVSGTRYQPVHEVVASEVVALLEPERMRGIHAALAEQLPTAEAARHVAAAGDTAGAATLALRAASETCDPIERAQHLLYGRDLGCDADPDVLLLDAVDGFLAGGIYEPVESCLDQVAGTSAEIRAEVALRWARLHWRRAEPEDAAAEIARGLDLVDDRDLPVTVRLEIEATRYPVRVQYDADRAHDAAERAWAHANELGVEKAAARVALGMAHLVAGDDAWREHYAAAMELARSSGDDETLFEAGNGLAAAELLNGDRRVARSLADDLAKKARQRRQRQWELQFLILRSLLDLLFGDHERAVQTGRTIVSPYLTVATHLAYATYGLALADRGDFGSARDVLAEGVALPIGDDSGRALVEWALGETTWLVGDGNAALEHLERSIRLTTENDPLRPLALATLAWVQYETGREVTDACATGWEFSRIVSSEVEGLQQLRACSPIEALRRFDTAATLAADYPRFALRSRLGRGLALRAAGHQAEACRGLGALVREADERGLHGLAGRVRATTPELEHRHTATPTGLSDRQEVVLRLVATGLTTKEVAERLELSPDTVDTHVTAAVQRLGARNRRHAASMLYSRESPNPRP
ncbi:MAG: LuxR C-terminal-related transcriptional regulator [Acidimicrobiia bacterium]